MTTKNYFNIEVMPLSVSKLTERNLAVAVWPS